MMKAIIFDAFGTLFKVTNGGSAKTIMKNITACGVNIDEKEFLEEWRSYYKKHTLGSCDFLTERDIFISRIQMFYDRYNVSRNAEKDADSLLAGAFEREAYPETESVLSELKKKYQVFIGSNTDNNVLESVMRKNSITVHKVYTSENLKCYKPASRFFLQMLEDNGLLPEEVLFVGDSVTDDILGPKAVGIKTVWLDRNGMGGNNGQDYTITDLNGLLDVLKTNITIQHTQSAHHKNIILEQLTHDNFHYACKINRDDIPEEWVDTAATIMDINDYGIENHLIGHTYLARIEDKYIGLIMVGEALPWETDPVEMRGIPFYRLMGFVVDREYRNRGLGGVIMEKAIEQVYQEFGRRSLALGVHKDNTKAGRFYERHGFKKTGVFEGADEYYLRLI